MPVWARDSSWIQFIGEDQRGKRAVFRVSPACESSKLVVDLSPFWLIGDTWIGIAADILAG